MRIKSDFEKSSLRLTDEMSLDPVLQMKDLEQVLGISRSTIWRLRRKGLFPDHVNLSERRVGWRKSAIEAWLSERQRHQQGLGPAGKPTHNRGARR